MPLIEFDSLLVQMIIPLRFYIFYLPQHYFTFSMLSLNIIETISKVYSDVGFSHRAQYYHCDGVTSDTLF